MLSLCRSVGPSQLIRAHFLHPSEGATNEKWRVVPSKVKENPCTNFMKGLLMSIAAPSQDLQASTVPIAALYYLS